jgi:anti-sigma B factor antagonist
VTLLEVSVDRQGAAVTLVMAGELDISGVDLVERELARIEAEGPAVVALDLRRLEFIDSSGMRFVIEADERARSAGRRLAIMAGGGAAQRLFKVLGVEDHLDLVDDPSDLTAAG